AEDDLTGLAGATTAGAIMKVRSGDITVKPGFDGEFGKIKVFGGVEETVPTGPVQIGLF
ncbi:MAG: hypothetical protein HZB84_07000, partial [Deltaproteobacteria bacterium]|nr:hypothetical protein [Deltaproteobacteria bacterium]